MEKQPSQVEKVISDTVAALNEMKVSIDRPENCDVSTEMKKVETACHAVNNFIIKLNSEVNSLEELSSILDSLKSEQKPETVAENNKTIQKLDTDMKEIVAYFEELRGLLEPLGKNPSDD